MSASKDLFKRTDIPVPLEDEDKRNNIIKWGKQNLYPQFLNQLFYDSSLHSGIIRSKVHYITSGGLEYDGQNREKWDLFFKNGNSDYTVEEVLRMSALDLEMYNGFIWKIYLSPLNKNKISKIEHVPYELHRKVVDSDEIKISEDWTDSKIEPQTLKPFNPNKRDERVSYLIWEERPKQVKQKEFNKIIEGNYPNPPYSGAIMSVMTDVKITEYQLNEINNNFSMGTIINLNNGMPPTPEEKKDLERDIENKATGVDNAGSILTLYNNGKDREASVVNINGNDLNDRYLALSKDVRENILLAHSVVTPILFGIKQEGSLGNATELEIGYNIMNANYFENRRNILTDALMFVVSSVEGLLGNIKYIKPELTFLPKPKNETPVEVVEENQEQLSFEEETKILDLFKKYGTERKKETLYTRVLKNGFDADEEMENCINEFKKQKFDVTGEQEIQILRLLSDGNNFDSIKKALSITPNDLVKAYQKFRNLEYLNDEYKITNAGRTRIAQADTSVIDIVFSYDVNPAISNDPIIPTTRDFCRTLVELSRTRVWSREDINQISARAGYNVFNYRGGWYHNPDTDTTTPWCRHIWKQEIVFNN